MGDSFYKLGGIYNITHIKSKRVYVGSAVLFFKRWADHRMNLRNNVHTNTRLQNFWNKYGENAFKFEIIEICDKIKLIRREQYWIDYYKSTDRNIGFNLRKVATSNLGMKHSKVTKLKMRLAHLGKKQTPEHIKNAANAHRGKKRTPEQSKRCQEVSAKYWNNKANRIKQSRRVKQYWKNLKGGR